MPPNKLTNASKKRLEQMTRAVCPDLTRERYAHNANSNTCVRMVARAA